jgi:hypothetical protein
MQYIRGNMECQRPGKADYAYSDHCSLILRVAAVIRKLATVALPAGQ